MTRNQRVKELRLALGLSQPKFAKAIVISNSFMAELELGNRKVNDRLIRLISLTFRANEEWLKSGEGDMFQDAVTPLAERALTLFRNLAPGYQQYVLNQMEQLLELQQEEQPH